MFPIDGLDRGRLVRGEDFTNDHLRGIFGRDDSFGDPELVDDYRQVDCCALHFRK